MNIIQFMRTLDDPDFFNKNNVIYFSSEALDSLGITALKKLLKKKTPSIVTLEVTLENLSSLYAQLSMSFLGERIFFWLNGVNDLDASQKKKFQKYLTTYTGPHIIFSPSVSSKQSDFLVIDIPPLIQKNDFVLLFDCIYTKKANPLLIEKIFAHHTQLPFNTAFLMMEYVLLVSRQQSDIFVNQWLPLLIDSKYSLFTLSTYFFSKNKTKFFNLWSSLSSVYSTPFWISYWSEQLFQAYNVIVYAQQNKFIEAKKLSNRLPFTFLQKEWKNYSANEIQRAHDFIYSLDWSFKNGVDSYMELFFIKFFLGEFKS